MPMRWTDATERMMLILAVKQNPSIRLNADQALKDWPTDLGQPTKRTVGDRFALLKKQIREGNVLSSIATGTGMISTSFSPQACTPQSVPKTPRAKKDKVSAPKQHKAESSDEDEEEDDPNTTSPNPISTTKGSSTASFKSRLLNGHSKPYSTPTAKRDRQSANRLDVKTGNKRKRRGGESEEESMTSHNSSSGSDPDSSVAEGNSSSNDSSPTRTISSRRSLPTRRSKSMTPGNYAINNKVSNSDDAEENSDDNSSSHTEQQDEETNYQATTQRHSSKKRKNLKRRDTDDEVEDSDDDFDPTAHRFRERDGGSGKKRKLTWQERVARMDGRGEELED